MKKSTVGTQAQRLRQAIRHRQAQEKQELRQAILTAAGTLFLEQGYEHFSLRKVAERIGYSPTTIYLYFRDKDDVLWAMVHGMVSLAITMPMFDASRIQRTMEAAWQMQCQGLRQH